jgi:CrcB protein
VLKIAAIAAGGSVGAVLRYVVARGVQRFAGESFPLGTLTVNVVGCFLFGLLAAALTSPAVLVREEYRLALLVGFLGAFTTFSTFGADTIALIADRQMARAVAYVLLSNVVGFTAVWLGMRIANRLVGV